LAYVTAVGVTKRVADYHAPVLTPPISLVINPRSKLADAYTIPVISVAIQLASAILDYYSLRLIAMLVVWAMLLSRHSELRRTPRTQSF